MQNILSLDPSITTGYAVAQINPDCNSSIIIKYGYLEVDTTSKYVGDWCNDLYEKVKLLIEENSIKEVCVEDYFFSGKTRSGSNINPAYRAAIHMICRKMEIPYTIINISKWKKHVAGRVRPSKSHYIKYGKSKAQKTYIQEALWLRYRIKFPNFCISEKTGRPVVLKYDIVDATAIMIYWLECIKNITSISVSVPVPENIEFKRRYSSFIYEEKNIEEDTDTIEPVPNKKKKRSHNPKSNLKKKQGGRSYNKLFS